MKSLTCVILAILHLSQGSFPSSRGNSNSYRDRNDETFVFDKNEQPGELVYAAILYRHGERTPERPYDNDPYKDESYWPIGWGMLTDKGKQQHYELGQWLRQRYMGLIPGGKYSHSIAYIRSTDWDRTLMSAESNLAGLFYPTRKEMWNSEVDWQPIPVHTIPRRMDKVVNMEFPCPKYDEEMENLKSSYEFQTLDRKNKQLYDYVTENAGEPMDDPLKIQYIYSTLYIQTLNNYPLPRWTRTVYPDKLYDVSVFGFQMQTMTKTLKRLYGGPLLKDIITNMKRKSEGLLNPNRNLWIYSAHDTTVAALLNTMGVFQPHFPPFTATVLLELRKNANNQHFVSVYYKNTTQPIQLTIPGCSASCPLDTFESLLSDVIPQNWDAECQSSGYRSKFPIHADELLDNIPRFYRRRIMKALNNSTRDL